MITHNNARSLMTPQTLAGNISETLPSSPGTGLEVVAINVGPTFTYTLTGTIDGASNLVLAAGESAILIYTSGTGWRSTWKSGGGGGSVSFPITAAQGGTGTDLSGSLPGAIPYFTASGGGTFIASANLLLVAASEFGDNATTSLQLSATDSGAHASTVSLGIELPNDGASPGDAVLRTGAGVERVRVSTATNQFQLPNTTGLFMAATNFAFTVADVPVLTGAYGLTLEGEADSIGPIVIGMASQDDSTGIRLFNNTGGSIALGMIGMDHADGDNIKIGYGSSAGQPDFSTPLFVLQRQGNNVLLGGITAAAHGAAVEIGSGALANDNGLYVAATTAFNGYGLFAQSASGISGLFQTSVTDGSNASPTLVARANTGQTKPLFQLQSETNEPLFTFVSDASVLFTRSSIQYAIGFNPDFSINGFSGNFEIDVNDASGPGNSALYIIAGGTGDHTWAYTHAGLRFASLGATGLVIPDNIDAATFTASALPSVAGAAGVIYADPITHALFISP